jgi:hypothetical protein
VHFSVTATAGWGPSRDSDHGEGYYPNGEILAAVSSRRHRLVSFTRALALSAPWHLL